MKKLIAIATAGCMLMAASAPAFAAPAASAPQVATAKPMPMIGTRSQLVQRAAATPRGDSSKFLAIKSLQSALLSVAALFAVVVGSYSAAGGFDSPGSA